MGAYPLAESPFSIGPCELRNRVVRTAHGTGFADGNVTERLVEFHAARAKGGIALTIGETAAVHPSSPSSVVAWNDEIVAGWSRLSEGVHAHGMKMFHQIWHGGSQVTPLEGGPSWSASELPDPVFGRTPISMTKAMIDEMVESFANTARRARDGGLDGVEIHGGHTYLVSEFLSPMTNVREDSYGGSVENRTRFAREILAAIRAEVGEEYPVGIRISASEGVEGGLEPAEAIEIAKLLEDTGQLSFLDVSLGGYHKQSWIIGAMHEPHGYELPFTAQVTAAVEVPTIVTGRLLKMSEVEQVLADGQADLVSMVRATIADPDLVNKSFAGREAAVRPCISCNEGCLGQRQASGSAVGVIGCTVNPEAGFEYLGTPAKPEESLKVVVVGAGPAGMEAAWTAATRGHEVEIYEASDAVGGLVRASRSAPKRDDIGLVVDYLERELERLEVPIHLSSPVDAKKLAELGADVVISATGSLPRHDGVQRFRPGLRPSGLDSDRVVDAVDVLGGEAPPARRAVVFDDIGHYPAVGASEKLLDEGVHVTFATSLATIGPELVKSFQRDPSADRLESHESFELVTRTSLVSVDADEVVLKSLDGGQERTIPADLVVLVTGFKAQRELHQELEEAGIESHLAGDAVSPLLMQHAIASGRKVGLAV